MSKVRRFAIALILGLLSFILGFGINMPVSESKSIFVNILWGSIYGALSGFIDFFFPNYFKTLALLHLFIYPIIIFLLVVVILYTSLERLNSRQRKLILFGFVLSLMPCFDEQYMRLHPILKELPYWFKYCYVYY
jgi:hypothetical protein